MICQALLLLCHPFLGGDQVDEQCGGAVKEHLADSAGASAARHDAAALVVGHGQPAAHGQPQRVARVGLAEIVPDFAFDG